MIYVDILILENFIINLFLLIISYRIVREKFNFKLAIISSFIGGVYALTMVIKDLNFLSNIIIQLLVAFVMVYIPLQNKKICKALKSSAIFIASSAFLSGICFKIILITNEYSIKKGILINDFKVKYLIICLVILFITLERITTYIREKNIVRDFFYDMEINFKGSILNIKAFLDSGNELREPVTNLPCILVEEKYFDSIDVKKEGVFFIPYSAVGYNGNLRGVKVKNIKLFKNGEILKEIDAILCPCKNILSRDNEFNALLSIGVI